MSSSALVFDLDGTFYDTKNIDKENKKASFDAVSEFKNISFQDAVDVVNKRKSLGSESTAQALYDLKIPDNIIKKHQISNIDPVRHIKRDKVLVELMRHLHEFYKLVLFTNTRREIADRIISEISFKNDDFDLILGGGDFEQPKPSIKSLNLALSLVGCDAATSFTIGDRWVVDHEPGKKLGMSAILVDGRDDLIIKLKRILNDKYRVQA